MCGIGGVLFHRPGAGAPTRGQPAPRWCSTLAQLLRHRGPDGEGNFVDHGVALVHTRLALVDLVAGAQPLHTPDGRFTLVLNGEIYNQDLLRAKLGPRGARFRTRSDSEVLLWTLALLGADGLAEVEGEYAFCFWDALARQALLGRDPLGVKPLLVTEHAGATWFASEAKALRAVVPMSFALDRDVIAETLVAPALSGSERTPFCGISSVPPGTTLRIDARGSRVVHSQACVFSADTPVAPDDLRDALDTAVRERLVADAAVGAFLSGGVDSSAIVAAALTHQPRLRCYTIRFDHHAECLQTTPVAGSIVLGEDAPFVDELAQQWPIDLTRVYATQAGLVREIEALAATQDRMVAWEQELSQRFLARAAAREVKAVLVGDAADETHYGYAFALDAEVSRSPRALLERFGFSAQRALLRVELQPLADSLDARYRDLASAAGTPYGPRVAQNRLATSNLLRARWLPRLLHNGDIHTMAFGLEARVPFADRRVLALAARVPLSQGFAPYAGLHEKALLRRAVSPWLPQNIIQRPKSALPRDDRLGPLLQRELAERLVALEMRARIAPFLDLDAVDALAQRGDAHADTTRASLFSVLAFEAFLRHHST